MSDLKTNINKRLKKVNLWKWIEKVGDPYPLIRPFLFMMDPEDAHDLTMKMLGYGMGPQFFGPDDPILKTTVHGMEFPNPICLASGLDKQAACINEMFGFGFGSVELGGVPPQPQSGNAKPRMFRINHAKALINRFGFNSVGADLFALRLKTWRETEGRSTNPVGVNITKNRDTQDDAVDYLTCFEKLYPYADYIVINVSCPNVPGQCDLQGRERMTALVAKVVALRDRLAPDFPLWVKVAPDLTEDQQADVAAVAQEVNIQALVVSNTTQARPSTIPDDIAKEAGGLSGAPLFGPSLRLLNAMYKLTGGKIPLVASGGVSTGEEAYQKIRAGASLVQVYTALVFEGPLVVQKIKRELAQCLRRDGFSSVAEAVGADHR